MSTVELRPILMTDVDRIHEWAPRPEASRYQVWGPNTWEDTVAFVSRAIDAWDDRPRARHVFAAESAGTLVGIGEVLSHTQSRAEISYAVHVERWGEGFGTAIARSLVMWAFENLAATERVEATCDPRNIASATVLHRTGMQYEGTLRHTLLLADGWRDSNIFSLLRGEFGE
jgi:[ribosomal protein S5]-alanine N-acetyltransferase